MTATPAAFAHRCLPLRLANEAGWFLLNDQPVTVQWNGGPERADLRIVAEGVDEAPAVSHFGSGIVTWHVPYIFRTPEGFNLLARGPANWPKDGVQPLEGLVETDWSSAPFTMNWKMTRPGGVRFDRGEPICMIVPQRRRELESFAPAIRPLHDDEALAQQYDAWSESRAAFLEALESRGTDAAPRALWQKHYFRGTSPSGRTAADHQLRFRLQPFQPQRGDS